MHKQQQSKSSKMEHNCCGPNSVLSAWSCLTTWYCILLPPSTQSSSCHALCQAPRMVKKMQTLYSQSSKSKREINNKKISDEKKAVWSQGLAVNHMGAPQAAPQQYLHSECNETKSVLVGSSYSGSKKRYLEGLKSTSRKLC